jgi:hypothetical protein
MAWKGPAVQASYQIQSGDHSAKVDSGHDSNQLERRGIVSAVIVRIIGSLRSLALEFLFISHGRGAIVFVVRLQGVVVLCHMLAVGTWYLY